MQDVVHNTVVANAHPVAGFAMQFLRAGQVRVLGQLVEFGKNASLQFAGEFPKRAVGRRLQTDRVTHGSAQNPSFFFTASSGILPFSFRALRARRTSISFSRCSIMRSRKSYSSMGMTAATGFLRRCRTNRSPRYAVRLMSSANCWRAALVERRFAVMYALYHLYNL